jgi:enoyl-CoA hydratase/carnithine racemase
VDDLLAAAGIRWAVNGPRATVTLDSPHNRNAQTPATWRALAAIGDSVPDDVSVVVLDAVGPSFSSGLDRRMFTPDGVPGEPDLTAMAGLSAESFDEVVSGYQDAFAWLRDGPAVSVAAVAGHAVGAGMQLALACDLRVCAEDAALSMREVTYGLVPDLTGTATLVDVLGYPAALELATTGRWVYAEEASLLGLATAVVPRPELAAAVEDLVAALTAAPVEAVRATKRLLRSAVRDSLDEQRARERTEQHQRLQHLAGLLGGQRS